MDLGWMDFTKRTYDPTWGGFHQVDLLADYRANQSPYVLSSKNPILRINPNGLLDFEYSMTNPNLICSTEEIKKYKAN